MKALHLELPIPHRVIGNSAIQFTEESQHRHLNEYRLFATLHCVCVCDWYTHTHTLSYSNSQFQKNINIKFIFYLPIPKILSQVQNLFI